MLTRRHAARAWLTEAIVVAGDAIVSRDAAALHGRVAGWRAAAALPPRSFPPAEAIDARIGMRRALRLRLRSYGIGTRGP